MSIVFSSIKNEDKNKNGYFRIGNVTLDIPPSDIITDRIINNDRKTVLRGKNEMFIKSGQSRWDVTINWTALIDSSASNPNQQWEDVQTIVAMFKVAPFVEVENNHLRQIFAENDALMSSARLAFGLRQLKVETHPDIVDGLIVTLTMTYFNYAPYTQAFGYIGDSGQPVDAYNSTLFAQYLQDWKNNNLTCNYPDFNAQYATDWELQEKGKLSFHWRKYKSISATPASTTKASETVNSVPVPKAGTSSSKVSSNNQALINTLNSAAAAAATKWLSDVSSKNYTYTITSAFRTYDEQAALYKTYIAKGGAAQLGKPGGPKYLVAAPGKSKHESGLCLDIVFNSDTAFEYARKVSGSYGFAWTYGNKDKVHWDFTGKSTPTVPDPTIFAPASSDNGTSVQKLSSVLDLTPQVENLISDGWVFDHLIENAAFFYQSQEVTLRDYANKSKLHAKGLNPVQISVLFVNNLAQIPLANYQYPTYQHIGPASSLISIQMTSVGTPNESGEPQHEGVSQLTTMSHVLENQFQTFRSSFRSIRSIHGMQAIFVENSILNLLGIYGILPEQISTEIVRDAADMVQVNFIAHQYENIYEEIAPYKVNGITGSYVKTLQNIVTGDKLANVLTRQEQTQLTKVIEFQTDYSNKDAKALGVWILDAATKPDASDFIGALSNNPTINLTSDLTNIILNPFNAAGFAKKYPVLGVRAKLIATSKTLTFADYLAFQNLLLLSDSKIEGEADFTGDLDTAVNSQITNQSAIVFDLYPQILNAVTQADSVFASQVQKLVNSPIYKAQFSANTPASNPSTQNPGHGAYNDLGLSDTLAGQDLNPAMYFINGKDKYNSLAISELTKAFSVINNTNSSVNTTAHTTVATTTGIPTDVNKLIKLINVPGYSLAEAFPTFKLFFLEDSNSGVYYAFDNFYSYNSVLEMEIIRGYDKPATAIIRLTNLSNLFSHKLYDNSLVGKYERSLNKYEINATGTEANNAPDTVQAGTKNPITGQAFVTGADLREGFTSNPKLIPLKYFPLQTGSKIQIRFGFTNDPDKLTPVFNGSVTEIEEGEGGELIITAQSFLLELATISGSSASATNSWLSLDTIVDLNPKAGPAYGGIGIFTDGGDAQSVIKSLLTNPQARHFGHFQLNGVAPDKLLQGYNGWQKLSGTVASTLGYTNLAAIINNAYDRSGENIMVNNYIDYNGTQQQGRGVRSYYDQGTRSAFASLIGPFSYFVDNTLDMSLWELIRDVSRRYPEYVLLEKFYGFPFEADSTLVFANPLDWYYTRPALIGDDEILREADSNGGLYNDWYYSQGKAALKNAAQQYIYPNYGLLAFPALFGTLIGTRGSVDITRASGGYSNLVEVCNNIIKVLEDESLPTSSHLAEVAIARSALDSVQKSYIQYVTQNTTSTNTLNNDRIKPVRRYHFIDQNTIIHNGIKLNDKIYNATKISDQKSKTTKSLKASASIPEHHTRMLDVSARINDPEQNVLNPGLSKLVNQSFLKEELGKMYRGEIILRGVPEIEPMDILMLIDPSTGIVGPVEVDQVVHSFTQEMGYVTIIKPRCLIIVNETTGSTLTREFGITMAKIVDNFVRTGTEANHAWIVTGAIATTPFYILAASFIDVDNPFVIQPLSRFNRPWIGGLQGFDIRGLGGRLDNAFTEFKADEIYPLMDLYKEKNKIVN